MASSVHFLPKPNHASDLITKPGRRRRQRYDKPSNAISSKQAKPYEDALTYAIANEKRLDLAFVFLTVWWGGTVYAGAPDYWPIVTGKMELIRKWLWQRGVPFYPFWTREVGEAMGEHLHLLVHCPKSLRPALRTYIRGPHGIIRQQESGAVTIEAKKYHEPCEGCDQVRDWKHLARCYFLKGSTDTVRERNGITECASASPRAAKVYSKNQGIIRGKRLGYPRPFAKSARDATEQIVSQIPGPRSITPRAQRDAL